MLTFFYVSAIAFLGWLDSCSPVIHRGHRYPMPRCPGYEAGRHLDVPAMQRAVDRLVARLETLETGLSWFPRWHGVMCLWSEFAADMIAIHIYCWFPGYLSYLRLPFLIGLWTEGRGTSISPNSEPWHPIDPSIASNTHKILRNPHDPAHRWEPVGVINYCAESPSHWLCNW